MSRNVFLYFLQVYVPGRRFSDLLGGSLPRSEVSDLFMGMCHRMRSLGSFMVCFMSRVSGFWLLCGCVSWCEVSSLFLPVLFSMCSLVVNFDKDVSSLICLLRIAGYEVSDLLGGEYPSVWGVWALCVCVCVCVPGCEVSGLFRSEWQQVPYVNSWWVYVPGFEDCDMVVGICAGREWMWEP